MKYCVCLTSFLYSAMTYNARRLTKIKSNMKRFYKMIIFCKINVSNSASIRLVYSASWGDCNQMYLYETKSSFSKREKKHMSLLRTFAKKKNTLAKYALEVRHRMNWSLTEMMALENEYRERHFTELHVYKHCTFFMKSLFRYIL